MLSRCRGVSRACVARTGPPGPWTRETKEVRIVGDYDVNDMGKIYISLDIK